MRWLLGLWYKRLRRIDMEILWPECVRHARNLDDAKAAFAVHAFEDPAWISIGYNEVGYFIDDLEVDSCSPP